MELIPIALGGLFFIACVGGGLVYGTVFAKGNHRWIGLAIVAVGLIGLLPLLMVAPPPDVSLASLSGTYEGNFGGGQNTFILSPDGTFRQRFVADNGQIYTNHGTYKIDGDNVDFWHLLDTIDGFGKPQKPEITNFSGAAPHLMDDAICFDEDNDVKITRIKH